MALNYASGAPSTRDTTPFILTSGTSPLSFTVSRAGVPSSPLSFLTRDLINTLRVPIEITELHFSITELATLYGAVAVQGTWAGGFEVSLTVGPHQITNGFVPLVGLEVRRDSSSPEGSSGAITGQTVRWILAQPLILKPNEGISGMARLSPNLTYPDGGAVQTCTLSMVARGRRLPAGTPVPSHRALPYASGWIFTVAGKPAPDQLFQNNLGKVLHVAAITLATTIWNSQSFMPIGTITVNAPGGLANGVIRGLVSAGPAGAIFSQRRAIEEAHEMNDGEAYQITLSTPIADLTRSTGGTAAMLLGWRQE